MLDSLIQATALPNLHPAVVHFPIALVPLALAFDGAGLILRRQSWLAPAATALYVLGALGAWVAVWAGERAADSLVGVPATVQPQIGLHSDWAHYALYALSGLAVVRVIIHLRTRLSEHWGPRVLALVLGFAALGLLARAADLGGGLVYRHGVAVARAEPAPLELAATGSRSSDTGGSALDRLSTAEDGSLLWRPAGEDRDAIGSVLVAGPDTDLDAVSVLEPSGEGLRIVVERPATLWLPGTFGDVQVEAELDLSEFEGSVALVHHDRDSLNRGVFSLSTTGEAVLEDFREGERTSLDEKAAEVPAGVFVLAVNVAGRHLKGLVDGKTVTHGHVAPGPDGSCGLKLDGTGAVRLLSVRVQTLEAH